MGLKNIFAFCCLLGLASQAYSRSVNAGLFERNSEIDLLAEASKNRVKIQGSQQGRVFPNPIVAKKLLLLKFKKLIPISLILLRSENGGEAELVPVYESSLIPSNVEFVSTPGGLSGHEDVQAIAIPSELSNKKDITQALQIVSASAAKEPLNIKAPSEEEEPLDVNEDDDQQVLIDTSRTPGLRSAFNIKESAPFEESSLYLYPYQENRGTKLSRRNLNRYHN